MTRHSTLAMQTVLAIGIFAAPIPAAISATALADGALAPGESHPGCETVAAKGCVELAIHAVGGRAKLAGIRNERADIVGHTLLTEQSYRQAPFITAYSRTTRTVDFSKSRMLAQVRTIWPESDPGTGSAESEAILIATAQSAVVRAGNVDAPGSLANIEDARETFALSPARLLLTASAASDLHYEPAEMLRSTPHSVIAFRWNGRTVKILLNAFNHLPDALEDVRPFDDFWFAWGDVSERVYYDNWKVIDGVVYPTNRIDERNGTLWRSQQALDVKFNVPLDDKSFAMDVAAAAKSARGKGWNRPFDDSHHTVLAPGIDFYEGAWNTTLIAQDDGVLVLEAPISPTFTAGVLAKARTLHPGVPVSGVLSTSDSWPHVAGVREAVANGLPVYVLDLNRPLLDRMMSAPHKLRPDDLQMRPQDPHWIVVSGRREIGRGNNRVVVYPLRGAATERQYMVYFPSHKLLYASDTLVLDPQTQALYDPELMHEVAQAVAREHLDVETVYAMHQGPTPWREVMKKVAAAMQ